MIRLNLIEVADRNVGSTTVSPSLVYAPKKSSGNKAVKAVAAVVVALIVVIGSMNIFGLPEFLDGVVPQVVLDVFGIESPSMKRNAENRRTLGGGTIAERRAAEAAKLRERTDVSVKSLVSEIQPDLKKKRTNYSEFLPQERINYQKVAVGRFFAFIQTATPDDIGFTDLVFEAPNYYYVRGLSANPLSQKAFLERLRNVSKDFRSPPLPENAPATDITAFGTLNLESALEEAAKAAATKPAAKPAAKAAKADSAKDSTAKDSAKAEAPKAPAKPAKFRAFIPSADVAAEVANFKALDDSGKLKISGLANPRVRDFGVYKCMTYTAKFVSDFGVAQAFIAAWKDSVSPFGIRSAVLERSGKDVSVTLTLDLYVVQ